MGIVRSPTNFYLKQPKERVNLEYLVIDGRKILKRILKE